jgi:hypothetical protein
VQWLIVLLVLVGSFLPLDQKVRLGTKPAHRRGTIVSPQHRIFHFGSFGFATIAFVTFALGKRRRMTAAVIVGLSGLLIESAQALISKRAIEWWDVRDDCYAVIGGFLLFQMGRGSMSWLDRRALNVIGPTKRVSPQSTGKKPAMRLAVFESIDREQRLRAVCFNGNAEERAAMMQKSDAEWEVFIRWASKERVLPAVAASGLPCPPEIANVLSTCLDFNRERNLRILEEVKEISRLLNEAGIEPVLLKGAAYLAVGVYADPGERYLLDLDLLIPKIQVAAAAQKLLSNGFEQNPSHAFVRFGHHYPPLSRTGLVSVELHSILGLGVCEELLRADDVIAKSQRQLLGGVSLRVPCPDHLMIHAIMHSQIHHAPAGKFWPPLRSMLDLKRLQLAFGGSLDWRRIANSFRSVRRYGTFALHLDDMKSMYGLNLPTDIRLGLFEKIRRFRRNVLRRWWKLRFLDPGYMFSAVCTNRINLLVRVIKTPGGIWFLLKEAIRPNIYRRFLADVVGGGKR